MLGRTNPNAKEEFMVSRVEAVKYVQEVCFCSS